MAETFLNDLLQTANIVPADDQDRDCVICLQETGTISRESGLFELQIRLPHCGHVVGSGCITIWLKENNSCPLCRREFFPLEGGEDEYEEDGMPDLVNEEDEDEDDSIPEDEDEDDRIPEDGEDQVDHEARQIMFEDLCENYGFQLYLDGTTIQIAQNICKNISNRSVLFQIVTGVHEYAVVAVAIYIAAYVAGRPRSPRGICRVRDVGDDATRGSPGINSDHIRAAYDYIYDRREALIDHDLTLSLQPRAALVWSLQPRATLVWPSFGYAMSDEQIECSRDLIATERCCSNHCDQLQATDPVRKLSQHIAANMINQGFRALGYSENLRFVFPSEVAAASIYIASHLVGEPIPRREIQDLIEDEYLTFRPISDIRSIYRTVSPKRDQLVDEDFRTSLALDLSWQSLEIDTAEGSGDGRFGDGGGGGITREDQEYDDEEAAQGETTNDALGSPDSRVQRVTDLCNDYCNRLSLTDGHRINVLAQELAEKFTPLTLFADCCSESIAAACIYIVSTYMSESITYESLEAITAVDAATIRRSFLRLANDGRLEGGIDIFDVMGSQRGVGR